MLFKRCDIIRTEISESWDGPYYRMGPSKNVLTRLFCFDTKLNFQAAQEKAERTIFLQFQNAAQEYLKNVDGIICVTGQKVGGVHSTMKLVPPGSSLYRQIKNWAHNKFH